MLKAKAMFVSLLTASLVGAFAVFAAARLHVENLEAEHHATVEALKRTHLAVLSDLRSDYQTEADAQRKQARADQDAITTKYEGALNEARKTEFALRMDASRARTEYDRLRQQTTLANSALAGRINLPDSAGITPAQYAIAAGELLAECGQAVVELAGEADQLAADLKLMVDAWPAPAPAP